MNKVKSGHVYAGFILLILLIFLAFLTSNVQAADTIRPLFYVNTTNNSQPGINQKVKFNINWIDDVLLSKNFFETNITGSLKNYTTSLSGTSQSINITNKTSSSDGKFYWKSYTNDSSGNWNSTNKMFLKVVSKQYSYPDADISQTGFWYGVLANGTSLTDRFYMTINETVANENSYIVTTENNTATFRLSNVNTPSNRNNHILRWGTWTENGQYYFYLRATLAQGSENIIQSSDYTYINSPATLYNMTITNANASKITDYNDLILWLEVYKIDSNPTVDCTNLEQCNLARIYWAALELPVSSTTSTSTTSTTTSTSTSTTTILPSQSTGGSSSGNKRTVYDFSVYPEFFKVTLKPGETAYRNISIKNTGNLANNFVINSDLQDFIALSDNKLSLQPQKEKLVGVTFTASLAANPNVYPGRISIETPALIRKIITIIEVKKLNPLFDIKVKLNKSYSEIIPGQELQADIILYNFGDLKPVDVKIYYSLKNLNGTDLVYQDETIAVKEQQLVKASLVVPNNIKPGNYLVYSKIIYGNNTEASSSALISVLSKETKYNLVSITAISSIVSAICLIIIISWRMHSKRSKKYNKSDYAILTQAITERIKQGYSKEQIIFTAINAGWPEEMINNVMSSVK